MPDPISYLKASIAAVVASAMIVLVFRLIMRKSVHSVAAVSYVLAVGVGIVTGCRVLQFSWTWPPANALNRFLLIVLPATVILELLAAILGGGEAVNVRILGYSAPKRSGSLCALGFRLALYASVGRILLHDSVYLGDVSRGGDLGGVHPDAWNFAETVAVFGGSFAGLIAIWGLLCRLSERAAAGSITLSLAMVIQGTGLATMMAGYIKGGSAAIPLAAALVGATFASQLLAKVVDGFDKKYLRGTIGIGVIGLCSLLCIGHYFGQLTGLRAIVLFLTPLLCWISELPGLRARPAWQKSAARMIAVTIVLSAVLFVAKQDFDREMAPLLRSVSSSDTERRLTAASSSKPSADPGVPFPSKSGEKVADGRMSRTGRSRVVQTNTVKQRI